MKKYIIITGDTNDGDYISEKTEITDTELEMIMPVINAIKEFNEDESITYQKFNWWDIDAKKDTKPQYMTPEERYIESGKCTEEQMDYFRDYCPSGGEDGIHTIESIEILEVINEIRLL